MQHKKHVTTLHSFFQTIPIDIFNVWICEVNSELENTLLYHQTFWKYHRMYLLYFTNFKDTVFIFSWFRNKTSIIILININPCQIVVISCRSCFELLLSVPENEIPYEAWVQFHHSVQVLDLISKHCLLMGYRPLLK